MNFGKHLLYKIKIDLTVQRIPVIFIKKLMIMKKYEYKMIFYR